MFSRNKNPKRPQRKNDMFGIDLMSSFDNDMGVANEGSDGDDDEDLEAELNRITSGDDNYSQRPQRPARKAPMKPVNLDIIEAGEIASDEELSGDDDDPDLLNELHAIVGSRSEEKEESPPEETKPSNGSNDANELAGLLDERLKIYKSAEEKAKRFNETSKARRYNRGVKTLQSLLNDAKSGKTIDPAEIPPELPKSATSSDPPAAPAPPAVLPPELNVEADAPAVAAPTAENPEEPPPESIPVEIDEEKLQLLKSRQQEFRIAAVAWKKSGNVEEAVKLVKIAKQFDIVIGALNEGKPVDLSDMPGSPQLPGVTTSDSVPVESSKEENESQETSEPPAPAPITGDDIGGALKERLEVYRRTKIVAEEEGNASKARRYGRICKQYEDAIKLHSRGKPFAVDELPVPPGFPPISLGTSDPIPGPAKPTPAEIIQNPPSAETERPSPPPRGQKKASGAATRAQKQLALLQKRQLDLKRAALAAKKEGDIESAREYLRQAKGIDPLIEASKCGLPVDLASLPLSPTAKAQLDNSVSNDDFTVISSEECQNISGTDAEIYDNLEAQLIKQKKLALATRDHCKAMGDVPGYNKWEKKAFEFTRDIDMLRVRKRNGMPPPQHHYEVQTHVIVQCSTDLTDNDIEICILRGINYPKEADTYVIYEFPYPSDNSPSDRTSTIKGTVNPEYDATFTLTGGIDRSSRQCQRAFKRHSLKCHVWSKGGFFRSDSLLGTVTIKLLPLETQCTLHDSFPIMNGRKATGGKLEVKMRLRNPIATRQIEKMTDKWLIIDN